MKKILFLSGVLSSILLSAQFSVTIQGPSGFEDKEAILYTLNGSKDIIVTKEVSKNNQWVFKYPKSYSGMMKVYFPNTNNSISFISENANISINFDVKDQKVRNVNYIDPANNLMNSIQDVAQKRELILPALNQIKEYYKEESDFGKALAKEIKNLDNKNGADKSKFPFINYYSTNYTKFLDTNSSEKISQEEIVNFIEKSSDYLESSSLLRPLLLSYLKEAGNTNVVSSVDLLINRVNVETPRGQTVLSELIDIFDVYDMSEYKTKYLTLAKNLKCTINERLASTIKSNANVEIGAKFPNFVFKNATNTKAKSLAEVKADKKIVVFWSSTCSHCENELPKLLEKYKELKKKNIEVIALSLDTEKEVYTKKIAAFPWVNDTELRGWNSSFTETYNIHATPTYFILDSNNVIISKPDHVGDVLLKIF